MAIDFSSLVLRPAAAAFAREAMINPLVSQPGAEPYAARGVFATTPIDVQLQDGAIFSDQTTTLGIRLCEFAVAPMQGDRVAIDGVTYAVGDVDVDGQGGASLNLRKVIA